MYVEKLTMKDFRCFEQAEVSFVYPGKEGLPEGALDNVTLLIGINGTGKTSVLRGVALAQLGPVISSAGLTPRNFVRVSRNGHDSQGEAKLRTQFPASEKWLGKHLFGADDIDPGAELSVVRLLDTEMFTGYRWSSRGFFSEGLSLFKPQHDNSFFDNSSPRFFLLGYGSSRRTDPEENAASYRPLYRHIRYQRVAGLFDERITLHPISAWYSTVESQARQKEVGELLNSLLPEGTALVEVDNSDALFTHNGVKLPFGALSDGFRSYIGLVADMLYHLNYVCPKKSKLTDLSGVVMIDDIDVHLHPKWQREVVPKLAKTFPKLQFIITSHSPLVAGTLHAANIRVVEDNQIHEYTERIHGLSADQILLSSYFGLDSTRAPAAERNLDAMAKRVADTHDPAPAIAFLEELAGKSNGPKAAKKKPRRP